jgi:penicillin amidase
LAGAALAVAVPAAVGCRPTAPPAPAPAEASKVPPLSGTLALTGLSAPVSIVRDRWGIPHISASTDDDLFFAQGFVQAVDRLFQIDLWRRSAQGGLSEVLGANFIERDAMTRRMKYRGDLDAEWASYGPDAKRIAGAFVRGINAWVTRARAQPPEEFVLAGWLPEPWQPEDLLSRTDAYVASRDALEEVQRARLAAAVGRDGLDALMPRTDGRRTEVPEGLDLGAINAVLGDLLRRAGTRPFFSGLAAPVPGPPEDAAPGVGSEGRHLTGSRGAGLDGPGDARAGGTAWAVAGPRSGTGAPLLAADSHRLLDVPAARYLVHLDAPGWKVIGATAPWLPGVAVGHNERAAWAMTAASLDVQDIYVERTNPANPAQVDRRGRWIGITVDRDRIPVKGREAPFEFSREYTDQGVIVARDPQRHLAFVLRWSGAEPGSAAELGALAIGRAQNWKQFQAALSRWKLPAAEFVYADRDGTIAAQTAALAPRRVGARGDLPVPAWPGRHQWLGWLPLDALPHSVRPRDQVVVSAGGSLARGTRIRTVLAGTTRAGVGEFERLQHDVLSWNATQLLPLLKQVQTRGAAEEARHRLLSWDRMITVDSVDATLYLVWEAALRRLLVEQRLPADLAREFGGIRQSIVPILVAPSQAWFAGNSRQARDRLLVNALDAAVQDAGRRGIGGTPWGNAHAVTFSHPLAVGERARSRFNLGPFEAPGYSDTVFAVSGSDPPTGPTLQIIFDVGDWDRSVATSAPGQAESPHSPYVSNLADVWVRGGYVPLPFSAAAVRANAQSTLTLVPVVTPSLPSESQAAPAVR